MKNTASGVQYEIIHSVHQSEVYSMLNNFYANRNFLFQAHLYSLGMTLLFAAEYNVSVAVQRPFSPDLGQTINKYNPYSFLLHRTNTLYLNSVD